MFFEPGGRPRRLMVGAAAEIGATLPSLAFSLATGGFTLLTPSLATGIGSELSGGGGGMSVPGG